MRESIIMAEPGTPQEMEDIVRAVTNVLRQFEPTHPSIIMQALESISVSTACNGGLPREDAIAGYERRVHFTYDRLKTMEGIQ